MENRNGFTNAEKKLMMLPDETQEGLKITGKTFVVTYPIALTVSKMQSHYLSHAVKSFVEVTRYLLSQPGVKFILSERFCQDPLECFFGRQRSCGGRNDNPTVQQFLKSTVSLRVQGSLALKHLRGNCRKRPLDDDMVIDNSSLPKRRRKSRQFI